MSKCRPNYRIRKYIGPLRVNRGRRWVRCGVCGTANSSKYCGWVQDFGYEKLVSDNREKIKSAERVIAIFRCRKCGYVSSLLGYARNKDKKTVRSLKYKLCGGHAFPMTAAAFYRRAIIELNRDEPNYAHVFMNFDYAARGCDEKGRLYLAELCRLKAHGAYEKIPTDQLTEGLTVNCIDNLRRARRFTKAIEMCDEFNPSDEEAKVITAFEKSRCEKQNSNSFSASEAFEIYLSEKTEPESD